MFCALNGATFTPRRASARHSPATMTDLPASDDVPATRRPDGAERRSAAGAPDHPAGRGRNATRRVLRCRHAAAPGRRRQPGPARPAVGRRVAARVRGSRSARCTGSTCSAHRLAPGRTLPSQWLAAVPVGMLTTTGARSGQPRTVPLMLGAARGRVGRHRLPLRLGDAAGVVLQPPRAPAGLARGRRRRAPGPGRAGAGARTRSACARRRSSSTAATRPTRSAPAGATSASSCCTPSTTERARGAAVGRRCQLYSGSPSASRR